MTVAKRAWAVKGEEIWQLWLGVKGVGREGALAAQQQSLQALVETWVAQWVGRRKGESRGRADGAGAKCPRCGQSSSLRYAGAYPRRLLLCEGSVELRLPRLRCRCGAWVGYTVPWLGKRRRLGADVVARALELIGMRVSLRDAAQSIGRQAQASVSQQTICRALERLPGDRPQAPAPRVLGLDGVYVRHRGRSRVILIAHDDERGTVVDWQLAPAETTCSYGRLLGRLWRRGAQAERSPVQVLGDGAGGIWQAVDEYWPQAEKRTCWWHQLVQDRVAGRAATPRPPGPGRVSTTRQERWNREFKRRYKQMEAFRGDGSVEPTMRLLVERTLSRRTGSDWLAAVMASWLRPDRRARPFSQPCSQRGTLPPDGLSCRADSSMIDVGRSASRRGAANDHTRSLGACHPPH